MKKTVIASALSAALAFSAAPALATPFTSTSPLGLDVTTVGASTVGGIVVHMLGTNNASVVSQPAATSLFRGYADIGTPVSYRGNPLTIGIQTGFTPTILGALGGGLQAAAFRFTLYGGDSGTGDFDHNDHTLLVNGLNFGNWSSVNAEHTTPTGAAGAGFSGCDPSGDRAAACARASAGRFGLGNVALASKRGNR